MRRGLRRVRELSAVDDRVGLGWRPELAASILAHRERIDVVEVIADDLFDAPARTLRAMRTLAEEVPFHLHGVGLGLASCAPADEPRLARMARAVEAVRPEAWSEHLAFVRGGGIEIGHLAAPPRRAATIEGTARNLARAAAVVGRAPLVENVATLLQPPGSDRDEPAFIADVLAASDADLLLDLHNLHANAVNFGFDAAHALDRLPLGRVGAIHLAGGRWIEAPDGERRLLDDHLHPVPDAVHALLERVARGTARSLTVILERDGAYPPMAELLAELDRARAAIARGREERAAGGPAAESAA
jgi:uncharacterized protein (UPF0276 family)